MAANGRARLEPGSGVWRALAFGSVVGGFFLFDRWAKSSGMKLRKPETMITIGGASDDSGMPNKEWVKRMPKIELHAHLHGSIPPRVLADIYSELETKEDPNQAIKMIFKKTKTFSECFQVFDVIHKVVTSKKVLERIIEETLLSFAEDNVKYLELRSTPRRLNQSGHSRADYVQLLCDNVRMFHEKYPRHRDMTVMVILTIDNGKPIEEASETIDIAMRMREEDPDCLIVGLDFAPKPTGGHLDKYAPILQRGREAGLKVTIHYAEYPNRKHQSDTLDFKPDRLGHAVTLEKEDWDVLKSERIPIEMCPTSNLFTKSVESYAHHPFAKFCEFGREFGSIYPCLFSTDDKGIFHSDLTNEWWQMIQAHSISKAFIRQMTLNAVQFTFLRKSEEKDRLKQQIEQMFEDMESS